MRHSPFVNSSTESSYVFLVSDYIGPLWKLNRNTPSTQLYVEVKKLIQRLTQAPLAFINWAV